MLNDLQRTPVAVFAEDPIHSRRMGTGIYGFAMVAVGRGRIR